MNKTLDYYRGLPYTIELTPDPEEGWFVRVKELPGCSSQGDTAEEALEMIQDAMKGWLEVSLEEHYPIPEPAPEEEYSGKFVLRVPKSLHRELVEQAEQEGASLNTYCLTVLAKAVGRNAPITGPGTNIQTSTDYRAPIKQYSAIANLKEKFTDSRENELFTETTMSPFILDDAINSVNKSTISSILSIKRTKGIRYSIDQLRDSLEENKSYELIDHQNKR